MKVLKTALVAATTACAIPAAIAQSSTSDAIAKYRELLADGNPAELSEMRGEELWTTKAGPKNATLEKCDLGKGPGVLKGAYVELPRYFKDTDKVMDLEQRLMHCRMTLQGLTKEQATQNHFSSRGKPSDIEPLVAYITSQSKGMKMAVSTAHPKEKEAYEVGQKVFFHRAGAYDFACASCHSVDGQRIRLQELPNILNKENAQQAYTTWPAYRVSQGEVRTMQHRLNDCFRQQRFPEAIYGSDIITAVTMFMAKNAEGGEYNAPALKR